MGQYRALYRETRPEVFSEILGQDYVVKVLKHQVETGTVSHAYLFCGTRGTGKTTTARILAKAVNCEREDRKDRPCGVCPTCRAIAEGKFMDVIEIDAASNNGVENIRELRENVNYPPAVGRKKVYIIDEVHMLSTGAFNALLKTLEEPPEDVIFILATTNPEKLPQTVLSRCMRLDFRRVSAGVLAENIHKICEDRGVSITEDALRLLAANADGSVRDSLSLLEQCISSGETVLDRDRVLEALGTVSEEFFTGLTDRVLEGDISGAFLLLDQALREGGDVRQLMRDWMGYYRSLLIARFVDQPEDMLNLSRENIEILKRQSRKIETADLNRAIITLARAINDARYSTQARTLMEVAIVTIAGGPAQPGAPAGGQARPEALADGQEGRADFAPPSQADATRPSREDAAQPRQEDLDELWESVFEALEPLHPKLNAMRRASLTGMGQEEYRVDADSPIDRMILKSDRDLIDREMSERAGRPLRMVLRGGKEAAEEERDEKLAREQDAASKLFGVPVRIVDDPE